MDPYRVATRIEDGGELRLRELPFSAGEEVDVIILSRQRDSTAAEASDELRAQLPPVTRSLLGIARGGAEEDYRRYLEEKYR